MRSASSGSKSKFCRIEQLQRLSIKLALPAGGHEVVVQRRNRRLRLARSVCDLRIAEVEVVRQHEIVRLLESKDLVHHVERGSGVVVGEEPFHPDEMAVDQDLGRQLRVRGRRRSGGARAGQRAGARSGGQRRRRDQGECQHRNDEGCRKLHR